MKNGFTENGETTAGQVLKGLKARRQKEVKLLLETYVNSYLAGAQPSFTGELDITNALVLKPYDPSTAAPAVPSTPTLPGP